MPAPDLEAVKAYLGTGSSSWTDDELAAALAAETAAQAAVCRMPEDGAAWPADLAEALLRRVAVNLAVRGLPLGLQSTVTEAAIGISRVGGGDREIDRLEAPYRRLAIA